MLPLLSRGEKALQSVANAVRSIAEHSVFQGQMSYAQSAACHESLAAVVPLQALPTGCCSSIATQAPHPACTALLGMGVAAKSPGQTACGTSASLQGMLCFSPQAQQRCIRWIHFTSFMFVPHMNDIQAPNKIAGDQECCQYC